VGNYCLKEPEHEDVDFRAKDPHAAVSDFVIWVGYIGLYGKARMQDQ
jgi:hypothetical protein